MEYLDLFSLILIIFTSFFESILADCQIISVPAGGYVLSGCSTRTNSVCSIQCSSTGIIQSQICQPNGLWSGPQFNCYGANGFINNGGGNGGNFGNFGGTNYGGTNYGGSNYGQGFINGGQGTCSSLVAPMNGYYSGNCAPGIVGGTCVFTCAYGTRLRGSPILTCLSSGTWSGQRPQCVNSQTRWYLLVRRWFG